ncbi:MAG: carbohydrate binding domain-containing protein [Patescibacteria group bacterium]
MALRTVHKLTFGSVAALAVFVALSVYFSQVSFNASASKTANIVNGKVSACYSDIEVGQDNFDCADAGSSWCKPDGQIPGQCIGAAPSGATGIDCDTCRWALAGCSDDDYTTNCRYSSCTRDGGTKTCDKDSDAPSTCTTATRSWTAGITCPTDCTSSTQTFDYQYTCTTDGKKTKVYTSTAGSCRPSANVVEECDACNDTVGPSDAYTNCPWPQTCSNAQQSAGKAVVDCTVPSGTRCKPTNSGSTTFSSTAKRSREKSCCSLNNYNRTCSQGSTTEVSFPTVPSYTYSASRKSGTTCIDLPSTSLQTSCCSENVKSCTSWECRREGNGGKNKRTCKPYTCKEDNSGFTAGSSAEETGSSCSTASCESGDYLDTESVVVACPANKEPGSGAVEKWGKKKKNGVTCSGSDWVSERSVACCTQNKWACGYANSGNECSGKGGQTITQTCSETKCEAPQASTVTPINNTPEPSKASKFCPDENSSEKGGTLPGGADGNTLRYVSGGWSSNSFLKNTGGSIGIGVGSANPSNLFEISNAYNSSITTQTRITDVSSNPELQLQYAADSAFASNQHWSLYVQNKKSDGNAGDASLRIWGFGSDRVIIDKDGGVHATKFCTNVDTPGCTELTGGGGSLWEKVGATQDIGYSAGAVKVGSAGGLTLGEDKAAPTANTPGSLKFISAGDNTFFTSFIAGTQTGDVAYTLPTSVGSDGQFLKIGAQGALSWADTPRIPDLSQYHFNNIFSNGGFEGGKEQWDAEFGTETNFAITTSEWHTGLKSLHIKPRDSSRRFKNNRTPIKQNTPYSVIFWVKADSVVKNSVAEATIKSCAAINQPCSTEIKRIQMPTDATHGWRKISADTIIINNGNPEIELEFTFSHTAGNVFIDDIILTESPTAIGYSDSFIESSGYQSIYGRLGIGARPSSDNNPMLMVNPGQEIVSSGNVNLKVAKDSTIAELENYPGTGATPSVGDYIYVQSLGNTKGSIVTEGSSKSGNDPWKIRLAEPLPSASAIDEQFFIIRKLASFSGLGWNYSGNGGGDVSISGSGRIGIGTAAPAARLHVYGGQSWGANIRLDATDVLKQNPENSNSWFSNTAGSTWDLISTGGVASEGIKKFLIKDVSHNAVRLTIDDAGNVGIGTTAPASALHVAGATGLTLGEDKEATPPATNTAGTLKFISAGDNAFSTSFVAGTQIGNVSYTLPLALGTAGQFLKLKTVNGATSTLEWADRGGLGILNGLTDNEQLFAKADDTNVTLSIVSAAAAGTTKAAHTFALGWAGVLGASRGGTGLSLANATNGGTAGNLLRVKSNGTTPESWTWESWTPDYFSPSNPSGGTAGQFLQKTARGFAWAGEADPKVGTLTNSKWCTANNTVISCTADSPILTGTAQGQTLWWDNTTGAQKWVVDNKLTINSNGNVGIGTTDTKGAKFAVTHDAAATSGLFVYTSDKGTILSTTSIVADLLSKIGIIPVAQEQQPSAGGGGGTGTRVEAREGTGGTVTNSGTVASLPTPASGTPEATPTPTPTPTGQVALPIESAAPISAADQRFVITPSTPGTTIPTPPPSLLEQPDPVTAASAIATKSAFGMPDYVTITWSSSPNATSYKITRKTREAGSSSWSGQVLEDTTSPITDHTGTIKNIGDIQYTIAAINNAGETSIPVPVKLIESAGVQPTAAPGPTPLNTPAPPEPSSSTAPVPPPQTAPAAASTTPSAPTTLTPSNGSTTTGSSGGRAGGTVVSP